MLAGMMVLYGMLCAMLVGMRACWCCTACWSGGVDVQAIWLHDMRVGMLGGMPTA